MTDIADMADEAAAKYHEMKLVPQAAVWAVLREHRLNDGPGAKALARKILSRLGQRGAAHREKNKKRDKLAIHDLFSDMESTAAERGGDPED